MIRNGQPAGKLQIDLTGPDGNAMSLISMARNFGKQFGWNKGRIDAIVREMTKSDYEYLLKVFDDHFGKYVDLYRGDDQQQQSTGE